MPFFTGPNLNPSTKAERDAVCIIAQSDSVTKVFRGADRRFLKRRFRLPDAEFISRDLQSDLFRKIFMVGEKSFAYGNRVEDGGEDREVRGMRLVGVEDVSVTAFRDILSDIINIARFEANPEGVQDAINELEDGLDREVIRRFEILTNIHKIKVRDYYLAILHQFSHKRRKKSPLSTQPPSIITSR